REEAQDAINDYTERKVALELWRKWQAQIASAEIADQTFLPEIQKYIVKLKWISCPLIKDDREFFELVKNNLLEGLELDRLAEIVVDRLSFQFGFNLEETLRGLILAIRENTQQIGSNSIMVKNETRAVRPVVRNWLIDFLRNTSSGNPAEVEEANYLFSNPNAKALAEPDRQTLGKVLAFYDTFRSMARELAQTARAQMLAELPPEETTPPPGAPPQFYTPPTEPTAPPAASASPPTAPQPAPPLPPVSTPRADTYREPIAEEDLAGTQKPPVKPTPRIEGNIVDLKNINE
ncbi:MAG: proline-rich receptor-like protein kinase PERK10-like, partial [Parcubacteria group bacterium LiPW_39]